MTPPLGVHPHVVVVVSPLVCPSASEMAVGPITGLLVVLVIVVTLLILIALISMAASLSPGYLMEFAPSPGLEFPNTRW